MTYAINLKEIGVKYEETSLPLFMSIQERKEDGEIHHLHTVQAAPDITTAYFQAAIAFPESGRVIAVLPMKDLFEALKNAIQGVPNEVESA